MVFNITVKSNFVFLLSILSFFYFSCPPLLPSPNTSSPTPRAAAAVLFPPSLAVPAVRLPFLSDGSAAARVTLGNAVARAWARG